MEQLHFKRLPQHIGVIPDGNRRWALAKGFHKQDGYTHGIQPGFALYEMALELGIPEMTFYGFTVDNTKRPAVQTKAFQKACVDAVEALANRDADLLVIGNTESPMFPKELLPYTKRVKFGKGLMKINFLVNYGWNWDLNHPFKKRLESNDLDQKQNLNEMNNLIQSIASADISRIDLIIRWGGRRRLSGFLPIQTIYADFFVIDDMWPDFKPEQFYRALAWYQDQDVTLGG